MRARTIGNDGKKLNLALQGGGAHGAFTWGVLDHLLADGRIAIAGISGSSAGAVNAVMLADGLARGGPDEARKRLADFWRAASLGGDLPPLQRAVVDRLFSLLPFEPSPVQTWVDSFSRYFSPYDLNPLNINPLRDLIERFVDFAALRAAGGVELFISATNALTGRLHIFSRDRITAEAVVASACLPFLFRAVEIDGVPYWDGGYTGNPAIFPFLHARESEDVLVVQINPAERTNVPTSAREIANRINEIAFNSSLASEFRALELINRLIDDGLLPRGVRLEQYRRLNLHRIALSGAIKRLGATTKLSTNYDFYEMLRRDGRRAARRFLDEHFDDIGRRGTVDLQAETAAEWA